MVNRQPTFAPVPLDQRGLRHQITSMQKRACTFPLVLILLAMTAEVMATGGNRVTGGRIAVEYVDTVVGPQEFRGFGESLEIGEGEVVEILSQKFGFGNSTQTNVFVSLEIRGTLPSGVEFPLFVGDSIAGPATITASYVVRSTLGEGEEKAVTFKAFASLGISNPGGTPYVSSSAVVIPADAGGPVEVILESSVDLITWTRAEPGFYGSSTEQRFFRLRAVTSD
jgi:hypothetical protein